MWWVHNGLSGSVACLVAIKNLLTIVAHAGLMRMILFVPLILLTACDTPGPGFSGAPAVKVVEAGTSFTLRRRGNFVEAIRTSSHMLPKFEDVARNAGVATQAQTGCRADWVLGDPTMMTIGLECDGHRAPPLPRRKHTLFCEYFDAGQGALDLECIRA